MTAGNFANCLPIILRFEGGKSNDPRDPGGRTNKGITQRSYDAYRVGRGQPRADVYSITEAEVADCYRRNYWDAVNGDGLRPGEDLVVFDFAVNSGPARALRAWHSCGGATDPSNIRGICSNRLAFMQSLQTWPHFGPGWMRRVVQVQQYGLSMAAGQMTPVKIKVKPEHAGGAVIVAGGATAVGFHWFGSPLVLTTVIAIATIALAVYLWSFITKAHQMVAARAIVQAPDAASAAQAQAQATVPATSSLPAPVSSDPLDAAMAKVSAAKDMLALAITDAIRERNALVARGVALQAAVVAAEARLTAMGVDIISAQLAPAASQPAQPVQPEGQVVHLKADDLIVTPPIIGEPANS